jgi:hypothetical protein
MESTDIISGGVVADKECPRKLLAVTVRRHRGQLRRRSMGGRHMYQRRVGVRSLPQVVNV